jgi:hypothetical protein
MKTRAFDRKLEALEALRSVTDRDAVREQLRRALTERNNYLVSKAAGLVDELDVAELRPDLLAAYERFFVDPETSDPKCLAKTALSKALKDLGHHSAETYLRGLRHFQFERAWGGRADTASGLRGTCARALTECPLDENEILTALTDGLADPDTSVRVESAIAIAELGKSEGALLLRLKLLTGDAEPDVIRQCFLSLLSLAPEASLSFISRFLESADQQLQLEAACALAQYRDPQAIETLEAFWREPLVSFEVRQALVLNLAASPLPEAAQFLIRVIDDRQLELARSAVIALANSRFRTEVRERVASAVQVRKDARLTSAFEQRFGPTPVFK